LLRFVQTALKATLENTAASPGISTAESVSPVLRFLIIQPSIVVLTNVASTCAGNYLLVSVALRMTRGHVKRTIILA
jgi:ABC-type cobalamin transport system permease subunit